MNYIFHYYVTAFLAQKAGFSNQDAQIVAYSCQYVDNALIPYRILSAVPYVVASTHHFGFWSREQEDTIWIPFHFFPSHDSAGDIRKDNKENPWCVHPRSAPVTELLIAALRTDDLYRIGIALHTYADTWAHQNFSGRKDPFNHLSGSFLIPPVGHAQAESAPDIFHIKWTDPRLFESRISNHSRFMEAARFVYKYLCRNRRKEYSDIDTVMAELATVIGPPLPEALGVSPHGMLGSQLRKAIQTAQETRRKLSERLFSTTPSTNEHGDEVSFPRLCGRTDQEIESLFIGATGIPKYDRRTWRSQAIPAQMHFLEDTAQNSNLNDKISWIQHEIFSRTRLPSHEVTARASFFDSHLYRWSEAAHAHRAEATRILKNF